jgi:hypothetical protein
MLVPLSCFGGLDVPIKSFSLVLDGTKDVIAAMGARFTMRDPLPPVTWLALAAVRPDTVDPVLAPLEALLPETQNYGRPTEWSIHLVRSYTWTANGGSKLVDH